MLRQGHLRVKEEGVGRGAAGPSRKVCVKGLFFTRNPELSVTEYLALTRISLCTYVSTLHFYNYRIMISILTFFFSARSCAVDFGGGDGSGRP